MIKIYHGNKESRFWHKNGELVIDYGSHSKFYYVNFGGNR